VHDQAWREGNNIDANYRYDQPHQSAFARISLACFVPMIRGESYPTEFKDPHDIEKYDTTNNPMVWIDSYAKAMGILRYSDLLAARYLSLMMDGANRQWFQG
jgi:hypothetical protein